MEKGEKFEVHCQSRTIAHPAVFSGDLLLILGFVLGELFLELEVLCGERLHAQLHRGERQRRVADAERVVMRGSPRRPQCERQFTWTKNNKTFLIKIP